MMRTIGVYLLYAAVTLRGVVVFAEDRRLPLVIALFGVYGLLLVAEPWFTRSKSTHLEKLAEPPFSLPQSWRPVVYLVLQASFVMGLMTVPETQDFFALLFVPLSLQAVLFFGRRLGVACIGLFSVLIILPLLSSADGPVFGLVMGVFFSGLCFLFGGYAGQVQKAEVARARNQQMIEELQIAHRQLQTYSDQAENLAREQERSRLARELHDSVTQTVFSMNLAAQAARLLVEKEPPSAAGQLLHLEELAASALDEIQTLESQLQSHAPMEGDLPAALKKLAGERQARQGLHVSLQVNGNRSLSEAEVAGLYAIANEALTNIIKHSGEREAAVRLDLDASNPCLEIVDHGRGFDSQSARSQRGHLGLAGMAERAREIGWNLSVESQPGEGTRICVAANPPGGSE